MKKIFLISFLALAGCEGIETLTKEQSLGVGAVGGAVVGKTVEKVREVFTPDYKLLVHGIEICDISSEDSITCYLVPCQPEKTCTQEYERTDWINSNGKVITVRHSLVANVAQFCNKNPDACQDFWAFYDGSKVVIESK